MELKINIYKYIQLFLLKKKNQDSYIFGEYKF